MTDFQYQSLKTIRNQLSDFVRQVERSNPHLVSEADGQFAVQSGSVFVELRKLDDLCQQLGITG